MVQTSAWSGFRYHFLDASGQTIGAFEFPNFAQARNARLKWHPTGSTAGDIRLQLDGEHRVDFEYLSRGWTNDLRYRLLRGDEVLAHLDRAALVGGLEDVVQGRVRPRVTQPVAQGLVGLQAVQVGVEREQAAGRLVEEVGRGNGQVDIHGGSGSARDERVLARPYRLPAGKIQPRRAAGARARNTARKKAPGRNRGAWVGGGSAYFRPAAARSACALSVRSQVNSGSSRPKWP